MSVNRKLELTCPKGHGTYGADSLDEECPACADGVPVSTAQQIKDILVSLAVADKLPLNLNELDPGIFEPAFAGAIFPGALKDQYVSLEVPDPGRFVGPGQNKIMVNIRVKLDDEGVVVDAFQPKQDKDTGEYYQEPIASTWKTYQMMEV